MTIAPTTEYNLAHASEQFVHNLATSVEDTLWGYDPLRQTDSLIEVSAAPDGTVSLTGHVRGDMLKYIAGRLAAQTPGVTRVLNGLVADTDLESDVALALATDPEVMTCTDQLIIKVVLGVVYLTGPIAAADMPAAETARAKAETLARAVPGVLDVINDTHATVGSVTDQAADATSAPTAAGGSSEQEVVMKARLAVWKERAAAKGA
jgi:osmotically-inducible protein OsmY